MKSTLFLEAAEVQALLKGEQITVVTPPSAPLVHCPGACVATCPGWHDSNHDSPARLPHTQGAMYACSEPMLACQGEHGAFWCYSDGKTICRAMDHWLAASWDMDIGEWLPADKMPIEAARLYVRCVSVEVETRLVPSAPPLRSMRDEHIFVSTFERTEKARQ